MFPGNPAGFHAGALIMELRLSLGSGLITRGGKSYSPESPRYQLSPRSRLTFARSGSIFSISLANFSCNFATSCSIASRQGSRIDSSSRSLNSCIGAPLRTFSVFKESSRVVFTQIFVRFNSSVEGKSSSSRTASLAAFFHLASAIGSSRGASSALSITSTSSQSVMPKIKINLDTDD